MLTYLSKPSLKLLDSGKKIKMTFISIGIIRLSQIRTHIMTISQHNSVSHAFSVPNWSEMYGVVDVLTALLLSPTRLISIYTVGEIVKMWRQELDMYLFIYIGMTLSIIDMDFYIGSTWDWLHHFSQFLFNVWNKCFSKFSKVGRSVIGWRSG